MELNEVYYYTATIVDWFPLLRADKFKQIVMDSLMYLVKKDKIKVYAFVIMPNHIHLIWSQLDMNGKEKPTASFMKFTGHQFLDELRNTDDALLARFKTEENNRNHQFWQRNALPIRILDRKMLEQKMDYIHLNPLQQHWNLTDDPNKYHFSSCSFYEQDDRKFSWLTHYMDLFE
ncbi:transposase [Mucilaginibacter sp. FT3.2]|uniref:transposase n=1 Tax=Mucilaginibacter sp. FT3.2 TaxID=2723090 RepID=UPI0016230B52|nr:transposase [Mucilaginibacter sp. FT3.2]MBB6232576.1 REP element-mobilizing transposase RayT [Mucilaginibacter sp. FT3.2]